MDGFWPSASKWFSEKTSSPLYFTYVGFFVVWNWKFFQIIFLENSALFEKPRVEYVTSNLYLHWGHGLFLDGLTSFLWHTLPPAILTIIAILFFPYAQKWALFYYLESRFERKRMFQSKQLEHNQWLLDQEKLRSQTLKDIATEKVEQKKTEREIDRATTDQEKWDSEYNLLRSEGVSIDAAINNAEKIIYGHRGYYGTEKYEVNYISPDDLSLLDGVNLINIPRGQNLIEFTEKGKYFVRASKISNAF
ncbi:MAG TPA: hypothetical protein VG984_02015 [Candidatus Paceibacterota bacterium]|nr:hypothetical protein [Candidatus Paceibacterota bacterium]